MWRVGWAAVCGTAACCGGPWAGHAAPPAPGRPQAILTQVRARRHRRGGPTLPCVQVHGNGPNGQMGTCAACHPSGLITALQCPLPMLYLCSPLCTTHFLGIIHSIVHRTWLPHARVVWFRQRE